MFVVAWPLGLVAVFGLVSCGDTLPAPERIAHSTRDLRVVPHPPPPARVEVVPAQPAEGAVWVDGNWVWRGRRWVWRSGRWVEPLDGVFWAPNVTVRSGAAVLYYAEGEWLTASQERSSKRPRVLASAGAIESTAPDEGDGGVDAVRPTAPPTSPTGAAP